MKLRVLSRRVRSDPSNPSDQMRRPAWFLGRANLLDLPRTRSAKLALNRPKPVALRSEVVLKRPLALDGHDGKQYSLLREWSPAWSGLSLVIPGSRKTI